MQMPLNIGEVMKAAADTDAARMMPISVELFFDQDCGEDLRAFVSDAFATEAPKARVYMQDYPVRKPELDFDTDLAVLVAGLSKNTGALCDHIRGLGVLCRKYGLPVYANEGTWRGILEKEAGIPARCVRTFYTGENFYIGGVDVRPFAIPHDANEPVGFTFTVQGMRCGVATDIGHIAKGWMDAVTGCQALVLEANHDVEMVERGPYPQRLRRRILGRNGHLCNADCAKALLELAKKGTRAVILAHLSVDNNLPELAYNTVCEALCGAGYAVGSEISVTVARRDRVSDMLVLEGEEADAV